jgi:hypothetical protein
LSFVFSGSFFSCLKWRPSAPCTPSTSCWASQMTATSLIAFVICCRESYFSIGLWYVVSTFIMVVLSACPPVSSALRVRVWWSGPLPFSRLGL